MQLFCTSCVSSFPYHMIPLHQTKQDQTQNSSLYNRKDSRLHTRPFASCSPSTSYFRYRDMNHQAPGQQMYSLGNSSHGNVPTSPLAHAYFALPSLNSCSFCHHFVTPNVQRTESSRYGIQHKSSEAPAYSTSKDVPTVLFFFFQTPSHDLLVRICWFWQCVSDKEVLIDIEIKMVDVNGMRRTTYCWRIQLCSHQLLHRKNQSACVVCCASGLGKGATKRTTRSARSS